MTLVFEALLGLLYRWRLIRQYDPYLTGANIIAAAKLHGTPLYTRIQAHAEVTRSSRYVRHDVDM